MDIAINSDGKLVPILNKEENNSMPKKQTERNYFTKEIMDHLIPTWKESKIFFDIKSACQKMSLDELQAFVTLIGEIRVHTQTERR